MQARIRAIKFAANFTEDEDFLGMDKSAGTEGRFYGEH